MFILNMIFFGFLGCNEWLNFPLGLIVEVDVRFIYLLTWFCDFMLVWMLVGAVLMIIRVLTN